MQVDFSECEYRGKKRRKWPDAFLAETRLVRPRTTLIQALKPFVLPKSAKTVVAHRAVHNRHFRNTAQLYALLAMTDLLFARKQLIAPRAHDAP